MAGEPLREGSEKASGSERPLCKPVSEAWVSIETPGCWGYQSFETPARRDLQGRKPGPGREVFCDSLSGGQV